MQKSQSPVQCTVKPPDEASTAECFVLIVYIYICTYFCVTAESDDPCPLSCSLGPC